MAEDLHRVLFRQTIGHRLRGGQVPDHLCGRDEVGQEFEGGGGHGGGLLAQEPLTGVLLADSRHALPGCSAVPMTTLKK